MLSFCLPGYQIHTHTYEYNTKSYILYENKDENDIGMEREKSAELPLCSNIQPKQKP